jgi:hypothetical protein
MDGQCACCGHPCRLTAIETRGGPFVPPWTLCRACWRRVAPTYRRALITSRAEFRRAPHLRQALVFYRTWTLAVAEASADRAWARGAA